MLLKCTVIRIHNIHNVFSHRKLGLMLGTFGRFFRSIGQAPYVMPGFVCVIHSRLLAAYCSYVRKITAIPNLDVSIPPAVSYRQLIGPHIRDFSLIINIDHIIPISNMTSDDQFFFDFVSFSSLCSTPRDSNTPNHLFIALLHPA
jgi:hypothetical protein